jgi:hypothetical protein
MHTGSLSLKAKRQMSDSQAAAMRPRATRPSHAVKSGTFRIGGDIAIYRLGFGAMRVTGPGVWGEPEDRDAAIATLKRLPRLGVNFIDTADSYGPEVSENLIREALHPYVGILVATKGGLTRPGPGQWVPRGDPEYLIDQARKSRARLGVEKIGLWQLHSIDPKVPRDEQFGAIMFLIEQGVIQHAGLSNASVADIEAAGKLFPVATVQNRYNLTDRASRHNCRAARRDAGADRARLALEAQPGDAADPRHIESRAPRRKRRGGQYRAVGRGIRRDRSREQAAAQAVMLTASGASHRHRRSRASGA